MYLSRVLFAGEGLKGGANLSLFGAAKCTMAPKALLFSNICESKARSAQMM